MNWKKNYFTRLQVIFIILGTGVIIHFKKGGLELLINQKLSDQYLDVLFKYVTHLGDGLILLPVFMGLLFIQFRYAAILAVTALYHLLLIQVNKRILFDNMARPKVFLKGYDLHFVEGVKVHSFDTFPSGHTATAFAVFFLLALIINKKGWAIFFFAICLIVGLSRVYLLQHFFIDVYFGSIIGCLSTLLAYYTIEKFNRNKFLDRKIQL